MFSLVFVVMFAYLLWWIVLPVAGVFIFIYTGLMIFSLVYSLFSHPKSKIDEIVEEAKKTKSKEELKYPYVR
ncbi:hypothetical protein JCM14244_08870 [Venenivibrio stagnispumantis]|uniref:Uncharacterized protein n=1 Tax=Venenivibrio stagnispumantis TaxID=407998 RepID=A0AA46AED4_9AQUI|nr:hypothetical protein [Venenivibrio stagnispumantis]MCW4573413.1 hypothetical protein [Venenivibrio stagnispumantis]SMP12155.1 hypothetical protein SAMN06264868_10944 [Venenivibrio stagnispumantis]